MYRGVDEKLRTHNKMYCKMESERDMVRTRNTNFPRRKLIEKYRFGRIGKKDKKKHERKNEESEQLATMFDGLTRHRGQSAKDARNERRVENAFGSR